MSKNNVKVRGKKSVKFSDKDVSLWDKAIADAKKMELEAKMRLVNLRQAIKAFTGLRDNGVPFPGKSEMSGEAAQ